jgi:hypothetical protein
LFQKESWAAQVRREATLAVGAGGSGQAMVARSRSHLDRKLKMTRLAQSFDTISHQDYLHRAMEIMDEEN